MTNALPSFGIFIHHFEPLHLGLMRDVLDASGQVQTLHVLITPNPNPHPDFAITLQDKARWLQMACADLPFIKIHTVNATTPNISEWVNENDIDNLTRDNLDEVVQFLPVVASDANNTVQGTILEHTITLPKRPNFDNEAIVKNPIAHWHAIHPEARGDYTRTVAIVGGESSGKTTLVHKLANYYGADFALEMGRLYVGTDLGDTEVGLQYSDYAPIALDHAEAVRQAKYQAKAPVTIIDTDFVTTQAFCEEYEGRTHPFVAACIEEFKFDHTIFLANNTPWVADGMRSLGSDNARDRFEARLEDIFSRHGIEPHRIISPDYQERFEQAVAFIDKVVFL